MDKSTIIVSSRGSLDAARTLALGARVVVKSALRMLDPVSNTFHDVPAGVTGRIYGPIDLSKETMPVSVKLDVYPFLSTWVLPTEIEVIE